MISDKHLAMIHTSRDMRPTLGGGGGGANANMVRYI